MKKKILTILTVILMLTLSFVVLAAPTTKKQETGIEMIQLEMLEVMNVERKNPKTLEEATVLVKETKTRLENAKIAKQALLDMGYDKEYPAVVLTDSEILTCSNNLEYYKEQEVKFQEERKWTQFAHDYPTATKVWKYMKEELGWNDYVCAGVMGNFMAETGGQTLSLNPSLYGESGAYYGIAQWSIKYNPSIGGASLDSQLNHLENTVKREIDTYGSKYCSGFDYNSFKSLQNEREAALAFAKAYERCASFTYSVRQSNATKAYNYFVK